MAAFATIQIVPRHVIGKGKKPPSEQLTRGIIGCGGISGSGAHVGQKGPLLALCDGALIASGQAQYVSVWMLAVWPIAALSVCVFRMILRTVPFGFPAELQNVLLVGGGITSEKFLREFQKGELERSIRYSKSVLGLGMKS